MRSRNMGLTREEMTLIQGLSTEVKDVRKALEQAESTPRRSGPSPAAIFSQQGAGWNSNWSDNDWGKYAHLGGGYNSGAMAEFMAGGREKRISGVGPALIKMAALKGDQTCKELLRSMGVASDYDNDKLEAEYGCTTVEKAKRVGVPGYDRRTKKVLLNERRKTALAEGQGQTGGYTIPPQFLTEILTIGAEDGFIEGRCKQIPMNAREAQFPMLDITTAQATGTTPYYGGVYFQWQPEAATYAQTQPAFRQSTWTAWDLVGTTVSSNQLLADNGIGLDALLTQLFGQAIVWYKEYAFLNGTGAGNSMPLGILNAGATIQQTRVTPGHFKLADAAAMLSHLQIRSWESATWIMHQSLIPDLIQMVDNTSSNRLVWMSPVGNSSSMGPAAMKLPSAFLNGLPIFFTEKLPSIGNPGCVCLVDWSRYVIGNRMDMQIDVSPYTLFQTNQLMWRVITRCDGKPWQNGPITDAQGWTISPFITLA